MSDGKGDYKLVINEPEDDVDNRHALPSSKRPQIKSPSANLPPTVRSVLPIASYCFASILMTVTNKYVLSKYQFNMNFLLLTVQSVVTVMLLHTFQFLNLSQFRPYNHDEAKKWFPIAAFLCAMIYTGSKALQFLKIPIYTIFKNLTIILIAYGEVLWFGGGVTSVMLFSFVLMVLSSVIAGWSDITDTLANAATTLTSAEAAEAANTFWGYLWMTLNCLSSAGFVLYMRKRIKLTNFKDFDTVYYNNLLSIPILVILSLIFEDWSTVNLEQNFPLEARSSLIWSMIFSGISAFGISYTSAWCVRVTSSTTYSMVGALNKLPVAASGMIFFGDPVTFGGVTAILVGFIAGLVYAVAKDQQSKMAKQGQSQSIPMSASSQSEADSNKANSA